jgi:putative oxidoreductase
MQQAVAKRYYVPALGGIYEQLAWLAWPLVRVATGLMLIPHGAQKLLGFGGGSISGTAAGFAQMGFEPAYLLALYIACLEFFGGILLVIGFLTRPVALLVAGFMFVAAFYVHLPNGFFWTKGGFEYPLMWMMLSLALVIRGGGEASVDRNLGREF